LRGGSFASPLRVNVDQANRAALARRWLWALSAPATRLELFTLILGPCDPQERGGPGSKQLATIVWTSPDFRAVPYG